MTFSGPYDAPRAFCSSRLPSWKLPVSVMIEPVSMIPLSSAAMAVIGLNVEPVG